MTPKEGKEKRTITNKNDAYTWEEQDVTPDLDPKLQHILLSQHTGRIDRALVNEASDGSLRVDVTAVLRNPNETVPGLEIGQRVGNIVTTAPIVLDTPSPIAVPQPTLPLSQFFNTVLNGSHNSLVRVTFEVHVNRQGR